MSPDKQKASRRFPSAGEDIAHWRRDPSTPQTQSPAYRLAFDDPDFLCRDELRPMRLQLELMKPEIILQERGIQSTVVIFGGSRIPEPGSDDVRAASDAIAAKLKQKAVHYDTAREFARLASRESAKSYGRDFVVVSGGGPGIMEAANRGATDEGAPSIGLNIVLPHEQRPNLYITPELCFQFHYFAVRKMHFLMRAKALAAFPGGFGTLDELFETLTLIQTKKVEPMPVLLFGEAFWRRIIDFDALAEEGTISPEDLKLFHFVEEAEIGWQIVQDWYGL